MFRKLIVHSFTNYKIDSKRNVVVIVNFDALIFVEDDFTKFINLIDGIPNKFSLRDCNYGYSVRYLLNYVTIIKILL